MSVIKACLSSDRRVLMLVVILAALSQSIVAACHSLDDLVSPNAATWIAESLAQRGIYEGGWWHRLRGPDADSDPGLPRMFHLPGEPLYIAAAMKILPRPLWRVLNVPVTTLLIACAAWWGMQLGGRAMGLLTGLIGMFHPFVLLHGVIWDDTILGAALDWLGAAIVLAVLLHPEKKRRWPAWMAIGAVSGYAAITRAASQLVFLLLAFALLLFRSLPPARRMAMLMLLGMAVSLGWWGVRNWETNGKFFVGSTHDGITLWESVYPSAIESLVKTGAPERMNNQRMLDDFAHTRHMTELDANAYFLHRARSYMLAHPGATLRTGILKIADDITGINFPDSWLSLRNIVAWSSNGLMILLALPALRSGRMWKRCAIPVRKWFVAMLVAEGGTTLVLLFIGPPSLRYWITVQPIFWMADAWTVMRICGGAIPPLRRGVALNDGSDSLC